MSQETLNLSAKGENATRRINRSLSGFDEDEVHAVEVCVYFGEPEPEDDTPEEDGGSDSGRSSSQPERIRDGTNHHRVLAALVESTDQGEKDGATARDLQEYIANQSAKHDLTAMEKGNISSTLSVLYKKGLVQRERGGRDSGGVEYVYEPNPAGRGEIVRLGGFVDSA